MMLNRTLWAASLILGMMATTAQAQSLRGDSGPAEYPPSSYKGNQYVDSKGCVYIRAGVGGQVTWVPRVARNRQVVCGYKPSLADAGSAPAPRVENKVTVITPAVPAKPATPAPRVVATAPAPKPAPAPVRTTTVRRVVKPAAVAPAGVAPAQRTVRTTLAPQRPTYAPAAPAPAPRVHKGATACPNLSPQGQKYVSTFDGRYKVRCGPQAAHPTNGNSYRGSANLPAGTVLKKSQIPANTRVVPRATYHAQRNARADMTPPKGYKTAFNDDRLNPNRGVMTGQGIRQSDLKWTSTVPRRLIDGRTGRDVTALFPNLKAPVFSTKGKAATQQVVRKTTTARVSTRSTPKGAPAGHRYVQVGSYGVRSNADKAAARLKSAGLPVRYGKYSKGGTEIRVVLTGPFADQVSLGRALAMAKRAGFRDAFTRK